MRQSLVFVEKVLPHAPYLPKAKPGNKAIDFYGIAKQLSDFAIFCVRFLPMAGAESLIRLLQGCLKLPATGTNHRPIACYYLDVKVLTGRSELKTYYKH